MMDKTQKRKCPVCGYRDGQIEGKRISAVLNDKRGSTYIGMCHCGVCESQWEEIVRPEETRLEIIKDGKVICPHCYSDDGACWDEKTETFTDENGEEYEWPVGYFKCASCGNTYTHHWRMGDVIVIPNRGGSNR